MFIEIKTFSKLKESFEANQSIIYRIKTEVPIWKKKYFEMSYEWIDACTHH